MAATSDKARFYLEETVPELREWERREIFSKQEIKSIASKRKNFEMKINARGTRTPSDYAAYAEYEMNLDALRKRRVHRKGVKVTSYTGQRHIFSILQRGVQKFPGDLSLWMQYITFCRKQKSNKKLDKILTEVLRLHPTKSQLWIYAANYSMDVQADVSRARSYMQRGLRFCNNDRSMYIEYARLEMSYLAKVWGRRKVLGLDSKKSIDGATTENGDDLDADMIALPTLIAGELDSQAHDSEEQRDGDDPMSTPAMNGAIPLAIFDAAMKKFPKDENLAEEFFNIFADFDIRFVPAMLEKVLDYMESYFPGSPATFSCKCHQLTSSVPTDSLDFPAVLGTALKKIRHEMNVAGERKTALAGKLLIWFTPLAHQDSLGPELRKVISATERQMVKVRDGEALSLDPSRNALQ